MLSNGFAPGMNAQVNRDEATPSLLSTERGPCVGSEPFHYLCPSSLDPLPC